jgi:hypothetical protein
MPTSRSHFNAMLVESHFPQRAKNLGDIERPSDWELLFMYQHNLRRHNILIFSATAAGFDPNDSAGERFASGECDTGYVLDFRQEGQVFLHRSDGDNRSVLLATGVTSPTGVTEYCLSVGETGVSLTSLSPVRDEVLRTADVTHRGSCVFVLRSVSLGKAPTPARRCRGDDAELDATPFTGFLARYPAATRQVRG